MALDAYQRLARHLDNLPGGFPSTSSGVELRILRRLFTTEQAELAVKLSLIPEEARVVARRAKLPKEEAVRRLDEMSKKGLIYSYDHQGRTFYMAAQYVIGIWEYHVNDLDPGLIADMAEYQPHLFDPEAWRKAPQLRTIPVGKSLTPAHQVMPYEQAEQIIGKQKKLLVAPCICRREHAITGDACGKLEEACLVFGGGVDYYLKNGLGRVITQDEAMEIVRQAEKQGLVLQPSNAQKAINMCLCCGCCCGVLKGLKRHPHPASLVASPFLAKLDDSACTGCGVCLTRCQMDAFSQTAKKEKVSYDPRRCIGCGLCISTCPGKALNLERKPEQPHVPRNIMESAMRLGQARGKLSGPAMAWTQLKSKVDRLLAK
jgi:Pyruvate/2-oxoacid:ferredoxin oxidoreductase delta subunit